MNRFLAVSRTPPFHASITPLQLVVNAYPLPPKLSGGQTERSFVLASWVQPPENEEAVLDVLTDCPSVDVLPVAGAPTACTRLFGAAFTCPGARVAGGF